MIWIFVAMGFVSVLYLIDRRLRVRGARLGEWTQRLPWMRHGRVWVRGVPMELDGWCENCKTGWRYAIPHVTFTRRAADAPVRAYAIVCERCFNDLPIDVVARRYAQWWVDKNTGLPEGEYPDPREFEDLKAALRVGG